MMPNSHFFDPYAKLATGRERSFFEEDLEIRRKELEEGIRGARILIVGGAGSIGSSTLKCLLPYRPKAIHVVDQNENGLAELVRDLRSSSSEFAVEDFRTLPLDFGSSIMRRFLAESGRYNYVLNFAAIKHVRSEKDIASVLQMMDTNIIKNSRFQFWLSQMDNSSAYFAVSTDKAANPVNLMGASKRMLEQVLFSGEFEIEKSKLRTSSARFANVAFSNGSLLEGMLIRIQKKQPIAVPKQTRRYFISLQEAGEICLLASVLCPDKHLLVPRFAPESDLHDLESVARSVIEYHGYKVRTYEEVFLAKTRFESDLKEGLYPLLLTQLDTTGEKAYEEFVSEGEKTEEVGLRALLAVRFLASSNPHLELTLGKIVKKLENFVNHPEEPATKEIIVRIIADFLPELRHAETGKSLDQRM